MSDTPQADAAAPDDNISKTPDLPKIEGIFAWVVVSQAPQGRMVNIPVISFRQPNGQVMPMPLVTFTRKQAEAMREHAQMLANQCGAEVRLVSCDGSSWDDCVSPQRIVQASAMPSLLQTPMGAKAPC